MTDRRDYQKRYRQTYAAQAKRVGLTFGISEYRGLERAAKRAGVPLAAYVKSCAMQAHDDRPQSVPVAVLEELADLSRVVRTIANNVNQMARHSNTIGRVLDEQEVFAHIADLEAALAGTIARSASAGSGASDRPPPHSDGDGP